MNAPTGIAFGPDGNLYVANMGSGGQSYISRYSGTTGALIDQFVAPGVGPPGGLFDPAGIVFGPDHNLYVSDTSNGQIDEFNGTTAAYTLFVKAGNPPSPLSGPEGLAFGPDGNLYVADVVQSSVYRYNGTTGAYINQFVPSLGNPQVQPIGLAFGPDGNLYLANGGPDGVDQFDGTTGTFSSTFVPNGFNGLSNPQFLVFSPAAAGVPEPATFGLIGLGLAVFGFEWHRRGRKLAGK
jgi:sugar lactone lactonase YvrE